MKIPYLLFVLFFILIFDASFCQNYRYKYFFDENFNAATKQNASIIGRGYKTEKGVTVDFFSIKDNIKFNTADYTDSTLAIMNGLNILYSNGQKLVEENYNMNVPDGLTKRWDTLGRLTDSTIFEDNMPQYCVKYSYDDNNRKIAHEFTNYAKKFPNETSIVMLESGSSIPQSVWQNLIYNGRYALRQDNVASNTYLIFKMSDSYFNNLVSKDPKPKESDFFKTGQKFTINVTDIDNNKLKSKDLLGKVLVVNYWFINCKPCRMEMPELNELVKAYEDSANVKFIGISLDDKASIKQFLKTNQFDYQIVADGTTTAKMYGVTAYPTHVIIDGEGKVYFHTVSSPRQLFYWIKKSINELLEKQRNESVLKTTLSEIR